MCHQISADLYQTPNDTSEISIVSGLIGKNLAKVMKRGTELG
jgi:hypothetical protein